MTLFANEDGCDDVFAHTSRARDESKILARGEKSTITIASATFGRLKRATQARPVDVPESLQVRFDFAVLLVHEICHAFLNALEGKSGYEPFFGSKAAIAEIGFEAERSEAGEHGGGCEGGEEVSKLEGIPVCWHWPYEKIVLDYRAQGDFMSVRAKSLPQLDLAWRVPLGWFGKTFRQGFWDELEGRGENVDKQGLFPRKEVGHFLKEGKNGDMGGRKPKIAMVSKGYKIAGDRSIVRKGGKS
ncbi:hypothetical protein LTR78_001988 [Recurvomyces mirabilis]|uniref:Uncharacterized protein n=1 Tax=Recurvomyces mirabilis TaxID=574656 RepID=A0AAE0WU82_9PEZI|nr:hypothetical protein LTR78_001988 [Recurvomyces mirabilis]KAK5160446.1 hypothetical protein LTS14_001458 [Recurvomyces mirabilis]